MHNKLALIALSSSLFAGCASVTMESKENSNNAKAFNLPSEANSGLYIYRTGGLGAKHPEDYAQYRLRK